MRSPRSASAVLLCALVAAAAPAHGQAKPVPGCTGVLLTDKRGDAEPANLDLTALFFDSEGDRPTANISVADLSRTLPGMTTGISWYALWTFEEAERFVSASVNPGGAVSYDFGTVAQSGSTTNYGDEGDTTGELAEGPDGVIRIAIPAEIGGTPGTKLGKPRLIAFSELGASGVLSSLTEVDTAGPSRSDYTVGECPVVAPGATAATKTGPPAAARPAAPLRVRLTGRPPRARRPLELSLRSSEPVTGLSASLVSGKRVFAKGRLRRLDGRGTLGLNVRRRLRPATYALLLEGTAGGRLARVSLKVRLR